jgi:hypothetical protein
MNGRNIIAILAIAFVLAGCSSFRGSGQDQPIGIGSSPNDLKKSPCACLVLPNGANPRSPA